MIAFLYLAAYIFCGLCIVRFLLPRQSVLTRVWLGASLGLLLLMWLPALLAFAVKFSMTGHLLALISLAGLTVGTYFLRDKSPVRTWDKDESRLAIQMAIVVLPLTVLSAWLQYTHNVRIMADGSWWVGQSTYGDLAMHMSFVTSLKNAAFPPDYSLFPGMQLSYPFLMDSLSTSFYLFGWSLQAALAVPGTLMMALCYMGVMCLAREMTAGRKTIILAALLFFLNGGLGFLYDFDLAGGAEYDGTLTLWTRIEAILDGYYMTPTNQPTPNNLRWSNVIADLMLPQRTLLGGWCMVIPCFYLLWTAFSEKAEKSLRSVVLLGVWGGALPLIHTHSFVALALCSLGMLVYDMIHRADRLPLLLRYVIYGGIACILSVPQLFGFTFNQVFQEGMEGASNSFIQLWFNWVNSADGTFSGMIDGYGWFYVKNIGLPFIILVLALFEKNGKWRRIFAGALPIILAGEFIRFQPNIYDNNKLLYLAWLLCCMIVADWCAVLWRKLKEFRARPVIAALAAVTFFLSAGLTLWREAVSEYQAFSAGAVEVGEYVRDNTEEDATFMTGVHHLNPVASIGGRSIVCGPDLWLYYHGLDTAERQRDIAAFYSDPAGCQVILEKYGVDYIVISSYERNDYCGMPGDWERMSVAQYEWCRDEIVRCGLASAEAVLQEYPYLTAQDRQLLQRVRSIRQKEMVERLNALYPVVFQNGEAAIWKVAEK
ncbi:MAG: hypothetical protein E7318_10120 [Clostridiales bacterium]|nr:hypothetical protein [Clostridiales bacterium]